MFLSFPQLGHLTKGIPGYPEQNKTRTNALTSKLWIYDLRTNMHFTLKTNPLRYEPLQDFIQCYHPENRHEREESERFRVFSYDEIMQRDKVSLDIFWLRDESLEDTKNLPDPDVLAQEIVENLEAALMQFSSIVETLGDDGEG